MASGHGQMIGARELLAWACEAEIVAVVFNDLGGVLNYGRSRRLASPGQRLALAARDRGCTFPGCDRPPAWCQAHHVLEWIKDGLTDVENLCLVVCAYHHKHFARAGWRVVIRGGVPWWIPPSWEDPEQTPRRNTVHHVAKIEFRQPDAA